VTARNPNLQYPYRYGRRLSGLGSVEELLQLAHSLSEFGGSAEPCRDLDRRPQILQRRNLQHPQVQLGYPELRVLLQQQLHDLARLRLESREELRVFAAHPTCSVPPT